MKRSFMKSIVCSLLVVALLAAPLTALASSKNAYIMKVSVDDAKVTNFRSGSGEDNAIIGKLRNGTKVIYWGEKIGQMLKVMTTDGTTGYIYQGNLKRYGVLRTKQLYVTTASTSVYKRSGNSPKKIGSVSKGTPLFVYKTKGEWAQVKNMSGKTAYVKTDSLKKVG